MEGEAACVRVMITTEPELSRPRRGLELLRFHAADGTGSILVTYFNQPGSDRSCAVERAISSSGR